MALTNEGIFNQNSGLKKKLSSNLVDSTIMSLPRFGTTLAARTETVQKSSLREHFVKNSRTFLYLSLKMEEKQKLRHLFFFPS